MLTDAEVDARRMLGDQVYDGITAQVDVPGGLSHDLYEQWRALPNPSSDEALRLVEEAKEYHAIFQALDS